MASVQVVEHGGAYAIAIGGAGGFLATEGTLEALAPVAAAGGGGAAVVGGVVAAAAAGAAAGQFLWDWTHPGQAGALPRALRQLLEETVSWLKRTKYPNTGWVKIRQCSAGPEQKWQGTTNEFVCGTIVGDAGLVSDPAAFPSSQRAVRSCWWNGAYSFGGTQKNYPIVATYARSSGSLPFASTTTSPVEMLDPNWERGFADLDPATDEWLDLYQDALPQSETSQRVQTVTTTGSRNGTRPYTEVSPAVQSRAYIPQPAQEGTKEKKTRASGIARFLLHAFNDASEGADAVDAVFDALPDDVKKRWRRKYERKPAPGLERSDFYGQYASINDADWKLQAIWHNWDKLDQAKAVANIVKNQLEDAIIGRGEGAKSTVQSPDRLRLLYGK